MEKEESLNIITKELIKISEKEIDILEGWKKELENKELTIYSKMLFEEMNFPSYKIISTIPRKLDIVFKAYVDHESRVKYLDNIAFSKLLHKG
jgi:hypothetical protein